jgi:SPP1 gp7 family putative phage head morphogenesis protein
VRLAERSYGVALRKIARHVGHIIAGFPPGDEAALPDIRSSLEAYSRLLVPWAASTAERMVAEVSRRDRAAWARLSAAIGRDLKDEVDSTPVGVLFRSIRAAQVRLIASIPTEAAERVELLTRELVTGGRRYDEAVPMIRASGDVAASRATLVARTETAKAASALTQARALYVGSTHYQWMTANDKDVRPMHKKLRGTVHRWDDPPVAESNGVRHNPGEYPNCRCWAFPIIPEQI